MIVTRPAPQAAEWVAHLHRHAIDACALPLIGIAPAADATAVTAAWHRLSQQRFVFFVSPNAVEQFFALRPAGFDWPAAVLAGSPGPGTTRALASHGVPIERTIEPAADASQFDSESLWASLRGADWQGANVLIVRGDGGRDWLAQTLRTAGARVDHVAAYRRQPPVLDPSTSELLREALGQPPAHLWFFSSSEAIDHLAVLAAAVTPVADWQIGRALATHPRIAARARQLGFVRVAEAPPGLQAVVACIQSIRP